MATWDAQAWLRAVEKIGELKEAGLVDEADLPSLSLAAAQTPAWCFVARAGARTVVLNRFGSARRVALALGLGGGLERADVLGHWRAIANGRDLSTPPDPPAPPDASIVVMDAPGREGWDRACWQAYPRSVVLERELELAGVSNVIGAWFPPEGGGRSVVVAIKQTHGGHSTQALTIAAEAGDSGRAPERAFVIVVDEDIDIYNMNDVLWALLTRCDPVRDMTTFRRTPESSQLLIDATKPWEWKDRFAETITDAGAERLAFQRWGWILDPAASDPRGAGA